jgi:hypothetical protein
VHLPCISRCCRRLGTLFCGSSAYRHPPLAAPHELLRRSSATGEMAARAEKVLKKVRNEKGEEADTKSRDEQHGTTTTDGFQRQCSAEQPRFFTSGRRRGNHTAAPGAADWPELGLPQIAEPAHGTAEKHLRAQRMCRVMSPARGVVRAGHQAPRAADVTQPSGRAGRSRPDVCRPRLTPLARYLSESGRASRCCSTAASLPIEPEQARFRGGPGLSTGAGLCGPRAAISQGEVPPEAGHLRVG